MDDGVWSSEEEELNFGGTLGIGSAAAAGLVKSATIVEREQRSALPYQVSKNEYEIAEQIQASNDLISLK